MTHLLEVADVSKQFGGLRALQDLSFVVEAGETVGLMGPNGAGKTTLLSLLTGVSKVTAGSIEFMGRSLLGLRPHQIARVGIARTFQHIRLFQGMSAVDNVLAGGYWRSDVPAIASFLGLPAARMRNGRERARALELLGLVNLTRQSEVMARELPYGEQKRLEVARAIAASPKLLLLDEPAAGLNTAEADEFRGLLARLQQMGMAIILVEHNVDLVMEVSHRIIVLNFGSLIASGTPTVIQHDQAVIEAYLGEAN